MKIIDRDKGQQFNTTQGEKISGVTEKKFPELQSPGVPESSLNFFQNPPQNLTFFLNLSSSNGT